MSDIESKSKRQELAITRWRDAKGQGTLNLVCRFGKTRCAKMIVERYYNKNPNTMIVAVAHNDVSRTNLIQNLPEYVVVTTMYKIVNDLKAYQDMKIGLLIVDEIGKFIKTSGIEVLKLDAIFKLGLTGDALDTFSKAILRQYNFPIVDTVGEEEALANNWIAPFVEYNLAIEIEEHKKELYAGFTQKMKDISSTYQNLYKRINAALDAKLFISDLAMMYGMYTGVQYKYNGRKTYIPAEVIRQKAAEIMGWTRDMELDTDLAIQTNTYFNPGALHEAAKLFDNIVRDRNRLIINSRNKIETVLAIIERNPVPTIVFNESTQMAHLIAEALGKESIEYHSAVESGLIINPRTNEYFTHANGNPIKFGAGRRKTLAIEGMIDGMFKYLITVKALNEAVDIPILSQVITTGGSTNPNTHLQRVARGKTLYMDDLSKITTIINVYIKDFVYNDELVISRDAVKLRDRQGMSMVYWVDSIDEIFVDVE